MCYDLALGSDCAHLVTESEPLSKKNNEESDAGRTTVRSLLWVRSCGMDYDHHYESHHRHHHHRHHHHEGVQGSTEGGGCEPTWVLSEVNLGSTFCEQDELNQDNLVSDPEHDEDVSKGSCCGSDVFSRALVVHRGDEIDCDDRNNTHHHYHHHHHHHHYDDQDESLQGSSECDDCPAWEYGDLGQGYLSEREHDHDDCGVSISSSNGSSCCSEHVEEQPEVHPVWQTEEFGLDANLWKGDEFGPGASLSDHGNPGGLGEDSTSSSCFKSDESGLGRFWEAECDDLRAEGCCCCFCSEQLQQEEEEDGGFTSLWTVGGGFGWHARKKSRLSTWTGGN